MVLLVTLFVCWLKTKGPVMLPLYINGDIWCSLSINAFRRTYIFHVDIDATVGGQWFYKGLDNNKYGDS